MAGGGRPEKLASVRLRRVLLPSERDLQRLPPRIARKSWSCELQSDQMRLPFRKVTGKKVEASLEGLLFSIKREQLGGYCSGHTREVIILMLPRVFGSLKSILIWGFTSRN